MGAGATAAFAVPTGWIGNVAINDAGWAITGDDSLIEANFVVPQGSSIAVADVYLLCVSYELSFTFSISLSANAFRETGSPLPLRALVTDRL